MPILKCKMCGGDLNVTGDEKVVECEYCGSKQTVPNSDEEKKVNLFNRANRLRMSCEFDKAAGIYEQIIAEFPEEAEAYWGLCLANYGIEYVDDPATARKIPTCHRASFDKMRKDENYELALENADMASRLVYEEQAKEIDRIMGEILSVSRDEEPYDIFICYKETDNMGSRTPDSVLAQDIYDSLTGKGYRVFFSRITLEDKLGTQYEPYIFSALNSAKMMLVVGTDYEHMNAVWVKNEWSRFIKLMAKDKSKTLIPCYKDMDPYDMPDDFKPYQSQDCSKLGFMQDLTRGIDKIFGKTEQPKVVEKVVVQQSGDSATTSSLLERAFMFLEDKKWAEANEYCEKVLDIEPKNAMAYVGKLMADLNVSKETDLENCSSPFINNDNYKKASSFDENVKSRLKGYIDAINKRINDTVAELYSQLVDIVSHGGKQLTTEERISSLETEKEQALEKHKTEISRLEKDKAEYPDLKNKADKLNSEINVLNEQKNELQKKRGALEKELSSLGLFAGKQKKEVKEKISGVDNQLTDLESKLSLLLSGAGSTNSLLNSMVSLESLQNRINAETEKLSASEEKYDTEIEILKAKIEEEKRSGKRQLSLNELVECIVNNQIVIDYIKSDKEKVNCLSKYNLPLRISERLQIPFVFGSYPQGENGEVKPIEWTVLAKEKGQALIISKYALDCQKYNSLETDVTWKNCSLRKWLNSTFLSNAFSADEQAQIQNTNVSVDETPMYSTYPGNATTDKVFLLSIKEAEKYFTTDESRKCASTAYAKSQGAGWYRDSYETAIGEATCCWWLRSPGKNLSRAVIVNFFGSVSYDGGFVD